MEKQSHTPNVPLRNSPRSDTPTWWTDRHSSSWERVKDAFQRDWEQTKSDFSAGGKDLKQGVVDTVRQSFGNEDIPPPDVRTHPLDDKDVATARLKVTDQQIDTAETLASARANIVTTNEKLQARIGEVKDAAAASQVKLQVDREQAQNKAVEQITAAEKSAARDTTQQLERMRVAVTMRNDATNDWSAIEREARFGYGARMQYPSTQPWDDTVEAALRTEWTRLAPERTWDQSRPEVRRGWDYGTKGN